MINHSYCITPHTALRVATQDQEILKHYWESTMQGISSLKIGMPNQTSEDWCDKTDQLRDLLEAVSVSRNFESYCGATGYVTADGVNGALAELILLREELHWLFTAMLCDDRPFALACEYNWEFIGKRMVQIWNGLASEAEEVGPVPSIFKRNDAKGVILDIRDAYLDPTTEGYPWVVGMSWGKDSSLVLKLIVLALRLILPEQRKRPIHIICTDTRIELPFMLNVMRLNMKLITEYAEKEHLPIEVHWLKPAVSESYWSYIIGRAYKPPTLGGKALGWCTDRLKLRQAKAFETELLSKHKRSIAVLGTRLDESASRAASIRKYEGRRYGTSSDGKRVWTYAPIVDLTTEQVWEALRDPIFSSMPPGLPWGDTLGILEKVYQEASFDETSVYAGEDALDIQNLTPKGRMGCAVCFKVGRDKSLEQFATIYPWLQPLINYRELVRKVANSPAYLESVVRDRATCRPKVIKVDRRKDKSKPPSGFFTLETRQLLLKALLEAQETIQEGMARDGIIVEGGYELISQEEIQYIKSWWHYLDGYSEPGFTPDEVRERIEPVHFQDALAL